MKKPKRVVYPCAVESRIGVEIRFSATESIHIGIRDSLRLAGELALACGSGLTRIVNLVVTKEAEKQAMKPNRSH